MLVLMMCVPSFQAPYILYVEVLMCDNVNTVPVPSKIPENTLRYTRSEEDLTQYHNVRAPGAPGAEGGQSPRPEFSIYPCEFDDGDCWSQEDDDIIQVIMCW